MKVLIVIKRSPMRRFLVDLPTSKLVKEVAQLLSKRRNSQAITTALAKGRFNREIPENETHTIKADIILSEKSAHRDLMK